MKGLRLLALSPRSAARALTMLLVSSLASPTKAETHTNPFFGFDFLLTPIAIKWACGGDTKDDLAGIERLVEAFPEDAKRADISAVLEKTLVHAAQGDGLEVFLGTSLTQSQNERLCDAALPLSLAWVTPEQLAEGHSEGAPPDQDEVWRQFYMTVESLQ